MRMYHTILLFFICLHLHAQFQQFRRVQSLEVFVGSNVTRILTAPTGPYPVEKSLVPGLGWQAGAVAHLGKANSKLRMRTGLIAIYRHYHDHFLFFQDLDAGGYWITRSKQNHYHDLELPILFTREFSLSRAVKICPTIGVVPAWRLRELYKIRSDLLFPDGTQVVFQRTIRSRFNHKGPFNRFNFYASFQWQHTYESGRTLIVEPSFRFNIQPFFEGSGLSGPEDETISFGLNVGVLLNRKLKPQER